MPAIEVGYNQDRISDEHASDISGGLEERLRRAVSSVSDKNPGFGVTVEGAPYGPIRHNLPDLRVIVFYHKEWEFKPKDLNSIVTTMGQFVEDEFARLGLEGRTAHVRLYEREGHAGAKIG